MIDTEGHTLSNVRQAGVLLTASDDIENCEKLLYYLVRLAKKQNAHIGIVHVTSLAEYQQWGAVEAQIKSELRQKAEEEVYALAKVITEYMDERPVFYFKEGDLDSEVMNTIKEDSSITGLYLTSKPTNRTHQELIKHCLGGKGLEHLSVPLTIIPDHLSLVEIDELL